MILEFYDIASFKSDSPVSHFTEVDRFLQQSNIRDDELVLIRPVSQRLDSRSSWTKACVVRVSSLTVKDNKADLSVKLVTNESLGETLGESRKPLDIKYKESIQSGIGEEKGKEKRKKKGKEKIKKKGKDL